MVKSTVKGSSQYGFNHISSELGWHSFGNKPVEVIPPEKWAADLWASLAYSAMLRDGADLAAVYLPHRLMELFRKRCGSKDFGEQMPLYIFLMRCLVACHKEAGADICVSANEARKLLDGFHAVNRRVKRCLQKSPHAIYISPLATVIRPTETSTVPMPVHAGFIIYRRRSNGAKECDFMRYTWGNPAECRHSKGRNIPRIGKDTLAVYSTCRSPHKITAHRSYHLDSVSQCHRCDHCTPKK